MRSWVRGARAAAHTLFAVALCGCTQVQGPSAPQAAARPAQSSAAPVVETASKEKMVRTTLDNGLKVVLIEDHSAPVVSLNVWVRVGSADETQAEAGMAHVFEHMLFKGTEKRAVGEIALTVEASGGDINAYTTFDQTVYYITMASRDVLTGVDVLADAVQHSAFDPTELAKETEVVVEEIRRGKDEPSSVLSEALFAAAYRQHPYRLPVIGTAESVRSFTRPQLLDFLHRWYVPNNMTFVAAGDFDPQVMLARIEESFKDSKPRVDLAHPRAIEPSQTEPRAVILRERFEQTLLGLSYPITRFADSDTPYIDLLAGVLGGGDASRLYREVKDRRQLVYSVNASSYTPLDAGLFFVDAELEPENVETALSAISQEIWRISTFGPSAAELERARANLLSSEVRDRETMDGQARKYGYWEVIGGGIEHEAGYLKSVREARAEDLRRVAATYLKPERATITLLTPEKGRADLDETKLTAALRTTAQTESAVAGTDLGDGIQRYELPNGLRVIVKRNPAVGLVAMRLSIFGGLLTETQSTEGISSFVAQVLERGTESRTSNEMAAEVEALAGSLRGFSGRNSMGIEAEFLSQSLDAGLDLMSDMLLHPRFDAMDIEQVRGETLNALKRREDSLAQQAFELFAQAVHPKHPYRFRTQGRAETVKSFTREKLLAHYQKYAHPRNAVLSVVGDVDPERLLKSLQVYFGEWIEPGNVTIPPRSAPEKRREPTTVSIRKGKEQVHVVIGFPGLALSDPDGPALEVLTQVLAGQGGRLFLELRDKQSLAYTVSAFTIDGVDPGSWGVYIASAPDKLEQSLSGLQVELKRVLEEPIADAEIDRARSYLIGSHAVAQQRFAMQAASLSLDELYGLGARRSVDYPDRIAAVTKADVERVARRIIDLKAPITAMVK